jgi:DNA repair exonuclease SbcCD ATPase subunit
MKFNELLIDNFLTIGSASLKLADKGLVLIQGENGDDTSAVSNGVGKSSITDALCWALFGVTARGVSGDSVVNRVAKKNCSVKVKIQDGATEYTVARYRKDAALKNGLHVYSGTANLTLGTDKETQALVEKILGCSYEVFRAAVYSGQEQMPDLPGMTDKQLKVLIEEAAGISRLERAYEIARKQLVQADTDDFSAKSQVAALESEKEKNEYSLADLKSDSEVWDRSQYAKIDAMKTAIENRAADFKRIASEIKGGNRSEVESNLAHARKGLESWERSQESLKVARLELTAAMNEVARSEGFARVSGEKVKQIKAQIANAVDDVGKPCVACGKPHTEADRDEYLKHATERLAEAVPEFKKHMASVEARRNTLAQVRERVLELEAIPPPSVMIARIAELEKELRLLDEKMEYLRRMTEDQRRDTAALAALEKEANPLLASVERVESMIKVIGKKLAEHIKLREAAQLAKQDAEDCVKVFGPAGVRAHILDTVTPFLNDRTAEYLSILSDGNINAIWTTLVRNKSGELREKFTIEVTNDKGGESFAALSGGEKRKVRLATVLALQDLVATRATKPIDLWIGDEIDDALDTAGLERLMTILERRARDRGTVLVISHNDLKDWCDQVAIVKKSGGYSKVEGALCD